MLFWLFRKMLRPKRTLTAKRRKTNPASIRQQFAKGLKEKQETAFENELIGCRRTGIQDWRAGDSCTETKNSQQPSFAKFSPQANDLVGYSSCRHPPDGGDSESARIWSSRQF